MPMNEESPKVSIRHLEDPKKEQNWYFTFGCGQLHVGKYLRIFGTYESARDKMVEQYGTRWCGQYSEDGEYDPARYGDTELK